MPTEIYGIRHHGPGSARSVRQALDRFQPDVVLIEGPPDASALIELAGRPGVRPPVALLVWAKDEVARAAFYPFAEFSPEWQAIRWALLHGAEVEFADEPMSVAFANPSGPSGPGFDPLEELARAAGRSDGEDWWEDFAETRATEGDVFSAILEAMHAVRSDSEDLVDDGTLRREAFMRKALRAAEKRAERIAFVCGAFHAPALFHRPTIKSDNARLKGLKKKKTESTWIPWTHRRLTRRSGYGAGVRSPGWYHHLWSQRDDTTVRWLVNTARTLRSRDIDVAASHVIDAVRLADALAALRGRSIPGYDELRDATVSVMCQGDTAPLALIVEELEIGDALGAVSDDTPTVPIHHDYRARVRRLRLKLLAVDKPMDLDLRKPLDRERSQFFHRLSLLDVPLASPREDERTAKGTFREPWVLHWRPELEVRLIECAIYGTTVEAAATARVREAAEEGAHLTALSGMVDHVLNAALPVAAESLLARIESVAADTADVRVLLEAFAPLARVARYGDVRDSDRRLVLEVAAGLLKRASAGLLAACRGIDDDAAQDLAAWIVRTDDAVRPFPELTDGWDAALISLAGRDSLGSGAAPRCEGLAVRIGFDREHLLIDAVRQRVSVALSRASDPEDAGRWMEGFLTGSAAVLLVDVTLFGLIDDWLGALQPDSFVAVLPLLRRAFSGWSDIERRELGRKAKGGDTVRRQRIVDPDRAARVWPLLRTILEGADA